MEKKIVRTDLMIPPSHFSSEKLFDYVLQSLKSHEMTCNKFDGYIDHIYQIVDIVNKELLDSGDCWVSVSYEASCFKPDVGKEVRTKVEMVFPHGIFSSLYVLRFLVPYKCLESDFEYIPNEGYRHLVTGKMIVVGSEMTIRITNMKHDKGHFSCIAELVEW